MVIVSSKSKLVVNQLHGICFNLHVTADLNLTAENCWLPARALLLRYKHFKVAKHSFQFTITFKPFMLFRPFFARVKVNHRRLYSRTLAKMCTVAMATGLVKKQGLQMVFVYLKRTVVRFFFVICPLRIDIQSLLSTLF